MNYTFKYGNFPQGPGLLGEQLLSIFDNFVTEPGVRLFKAGVYTCRFANIIEDIQLNSSMHKSVLKILQILCGVGVVQASRNT